MSEAGLEELLRGMTKANLLQVLSSLLADNKVRRKIQKTLTGDADSSSSGSGEDDEDGDDEDDDSNEYDDGY